MCLDCTRASRWTVHHEVIYIICSLNCSILTKFVQHCWINKYIFFLIYPLNHQNSIEDMRKGDLLSELSWQWSSLSWALFKIEKKHWKFQFGKALESTTTTKKVFSFKFKLGENHLMIWKKRKYTEIVHLWLSTWNHSP